MYTGQQAQRWERPQLHGVAAVQRTEAGLPWEQESAHNNSIDQDTWLLSFVDILTLLLTLFVLLLAYQHSVSDQDGGAGVLIPARLVQAVTQIITPDLPPPQRTDQVQPLPDSPVPGLDRVLQQSPVSVHSDLQPDPSASVVVTKPEQLLTTDSPIIDAPGGASMFLEQTTAVTAGVEAHYLLQFDSLNPEAGGAELIALSMTSPVVPDPEAQDPVQKLLNELQRSSLQGRIEVSVRPDAVNLEIRDNILFTPASAELTATGHELLDALAATLNALPYALSIEGHTDNIPIQTALYPSNWELSAARATRVTRHLIEQGVAAERIRAIGYADTRARADNSSVEGRARNRRVSLVLRMPAPAVEAN